jgi:hypothetical protein
VEMKLPTSSRERGLFTNLLDKTGLGGFQAEYKERDKALDGKPACGNMAGSYQHPQRDSSTDFGP